MNEDAKTILEKLSKMEPDDFCMIPNDALREEVGLEGGEGQQIGKVCKVLKAYLSPKQKTKKEVKKD